MTWEITRQNQGTIETKQFAEGQVFLETRGENGCSTLEIRYCSNRSVTVLKPGPEIYVKREELIYPISKNAAETEGIVLMHSLQDHPFRALLRRILTGHASVLEYSNQILNEN